MRRRRAALLALTLAAALPGCGTGTPTVPGGISRAVITVAVDPNPVPIVTSSTSIGLHQVRYKVVVTETAGLGGEFVRIDSTIFDDTTGIALGVNNYDAADLIVFVGSKRLEAKGNVSVSQQIDFVLPTGFTGARLAVFVQFRDDRGNLLNQSILVVAKAP